MPEIIEIPIGKIKVGEYDQRLGKEDEDVAELVVSIRRIGIIAPLVVAADENAYTLIAGHRRLRAAILVGLVAVPCRVMDSSKAVGSEITFAENFFRKDLSPIELSCALQDCLDKKIMTVEEIAAGFHRSKRWVNEMVAIGFWPVDVQEAIHNEQISVSAGSNLALVTDDSYRNFLVRNAVEQGATARTTASWLQAWRAFQPAEEAIKSEPVSVGQNYQPTIPQAPCFCCGQVFAVNEMSHVPVCGACVQVLRQVGLTQASE